MLALNYVEAYIGGGERETSPLLREGGREGGRDGEKGRRGRERGREGERVRERE